MLYKIIVNKKWQKVVFIVAGMIYIAYAFIAFTTFKKLDWYQAIKPAMDENYYHVFQILSVFVVLRAFLLYKEEHDDYSFFEVLMTFISEHALLAVIFVFMIIDFRVVYGARAISRAYTLRLCFYFLLAASQYHYKEYLPFFTFASAACMVTTIVCQNLGIIENIAYHRTATDVGYSFGYVWPLTFQAHFVILVLLYLTLRREHITIFEIILFIAANTYTSSITTAKTGMILADLALVLAYILHFEKVREHLTYFSRVIYVEMVAIPVASVIVSLLYDSKIVFWRTFNRFLNNRLMLQHKAFGKHDLQFFGQNVVWHAFSMYGTGNKKKYNFVDNSFIKTAYDQGIGMVLILIGGFMYAVHQFAKEENCAGILSVGILFLLGIMQHQALLITINPLLLVISPMLLVGLSSFKKASDEDEEWVEEY